jgi:pyridoxal phosphate enzyme (YggS family)
MSTIAANLQAIGRRISDALQGDTRSVTLVAVSKGKPASSVREAFGAGCRHFGESYVQEALPKMAQLADIAATWHYVGHLQSNKARDVAESFDWVHGVDRAKLAAALSKGRPESRGRLNVLLQVNISGEASKGGVNPAEAAPLAREIAAMPRLDLRGLMGMASPTEDASTVRREFALLKRTRDAGFALYTLSMGMSGDFEAEIAEGSTMVRIGTAIFGERSRERAT